MKIIKITRDESFVRIKYMTDGLAAETHDAEFQEAPKPEFDECLQSLAPIAANILETGMDYTKGMTVRSLTIARTKHGTKSAIISFTKTLDAVDNPHSITTPQFRIDHPADNEDGARQCSDQQSAVILEMIEEAEKYLKGERLQTLLPLQPDAEDEEEGAGDLALNG